MKLEALISFIVKQTDIKGKKAFQKFVYLSQACGINVGYKFRMHLYGPIVPNWKLIERGLKIMG